MILRQYQIESISALRESMKRNKHLILQASCGAGKTIISAEIAKLAIEKGKKVLFLVNRRDLVKQTVEKYKQYGMEDYTGIILAGEDPSLGKPIQCASLQTYGRRLKLADLEINKWFHDADLIIYDECHSSNAYTYKKILELYQDKYVIGLSATPMGAGGRGLGENFDSIVECVSMNKLIELGFLVPAIHYAPSKPDLGNVPKLGNDYSVKVLGDRVDKPKLVGDIVDNWFKLAYDRKTIIFATNVKHSKHIRDSFLNRGVKIAHIDAHTNDEDRQSVYNDFENGDLQILTNVGVACEGSDLPIADCVCIARPTLLVTRWLQMAGRGARPYPGKKDYLLLDFAGCIDRHGLVDDEVTWSLDPGKPAAQPKKPRKKEKTIITCEMCSAAFTGRRCPQCGNEVKDYGKKIECVDADLVEVGNAKKPKATMTEKKEFFAMLEWKRREKGYKPGWAAWKYKEKFGVFPRNIGYVAPKLPDLKFENWYRYINIKNAKRREKNERMVLNG